MKRLIPLLLLLSSCISPLNQADVAADRARWTAFRDAVVDGVIDERERPLIGELLLVWDQKLMGDEAEVNKPRDSAAIFSEILRVYGAATVQVVLGPELLKAAPTVFKLIDKDGDGILSEKELLSLDPRDPVVAIVVVTTLHALLTKR